MDVNNYDAVAAARKRIEHDAKKLHPNPTPARAQSITHKAVDDVIRVMDENSGASSKQKVEALARLGKYTKNVVYRNALASAMAVKESAIIAALATGVLYGSISAHKSATKLREMMSSEDDIVKPFALAVVAVLSSYVAFHSFVTVLQKTRRGIRKMIVNGDVPWS